MYRIATVLLLLVGCSDGTGPERADVQGVYQLTGMGGAVLPYSYPPIGDLVRHVTGGYLVLSEVPGMSRQVFCYRVEQPPLPDQKSAPITDLAWWTLPDGRVVIEGTHGANPSTDTLAFAGSAVSVTAESGPDYQYERMSQGLGSDPPPCP